MNTLRVFFVLLVIPLFTHTNIHGQSAYQDYEGDVPEGCTTITVGKAASADGSVMTSHTCDSHRTRSWFDIQPPRTYAPGAADTMVKRTNDDSGEMPAYRHVTMGAIPQARSTYGYINTAYPCMNDHQLAVGESTFGGRNALRAPESGLIDCQQLVHLMLERTTTAREAIRLADSLTAKYGYNDGGECLTIADTEEVWHFEIVGPGKGQTGAVWAAQRVPDGEVSVNANASRIRQIDLSDSDFYMASENVYEVARDSGWWNPEEEPFEFCYAYAPESRKSIAARRREWRVLDLMAPTLGLHPESENYPFSVRPDSAVTLPKMVDIFQDYYQGTPYNFIKNITWVNDDGEHEISPLANPFMPYDMNKIFDINGGWGWRGERTIARWYTMYATITQSRDWLPDEVGGVVWMALDNVATSVYVPVYCSVTDVAQPYKVPGRTNGFTRESGWWAFNRLGTLTAQRWGDMRHDVQPVWEKMQQELFSSQSAVEAKGTELLKQDPAQAREYLTGYGIKWGNRVVEKAWELGDLLWTKYDEQF